MERENTGEILDESGLSQCLFCTRWTGRGTCEAYPGEPFKVPVVILANKHDHRDAYPGDGGLLFSPANRESAIKQDKAVERARVGSITFRGGK